MEMAKPNRRFLSKHPVVTNSILPNFFKKSFGEKTKFNFGKIPLFSFSLKKFFSLSLLFL